MHSNHYDIIIVGQGICGTVLSSSLILQGQKVLVIDDGSNKAASKIASGVINPVTGRRIVKTWQIDDVMPAAVDAGLAQRFVVGRVPLHHRVSGVASGFDRRLILLDHDKRRGLRGEILR